MEPSLWQTFFNKIFVAIFLIFVFQIYLTESRSITDELYPKSVLKRNSWWSKKSVENFPNTQFPVEVNDQANQKCEAVVSLYKCYVELCVPQFVECSRGAPNDDIYSMCAVEHSMCSAQCLELVNSENGSK